MDTMTDIVEFSHFGNKLNVGSFDYDKEVEVWMDGKSIWLNANEINTLVTHLVKCLEHVKEPIEILIKQ